MQSSDTGLYQDADLGTTRTPPRADGLAKLSRQGRSALGQRSDQEPNGTQQRNENMVQSAEDLRLSQRFAFQQDMGSNSLNVVEWPKPEA